jgi:hypothetical protein
MGKATVYIVGIGVVAAALAAVYIKKKVTDAGGLQTVVADVVSETVDSVVGGVVTGVGQVIGIPRTEKTACQAALDRGDMWNASFACPAGTFIGAGWDRATSSVSDWFK